MKQAKTTARGYGADHQRMRRMLLPDAYGKPCHLCGRIMQRGDDLDLDHSDDRQSYIGICCARCNRAKGGRKAQALRRAKYSTQLRTSREW